jgi:gas vesicle protein
MAIEKTSASPITESPGLNTRTRPISAQARASSVSSDLRSQAGDVMEKVGDTAQQAAADIKRTASSLAKATDETVEDISSMVQTGIDKMRETAGIVSEKVSRRVSSAAGSAEARAAELRNWSSEAREAMSVRMEEASIAGTPLHETVTRRMNGMYEVAHNAADTLTSPDARDNYLLGAAALAVGAAAIISYRRQNDRTS